MNLQISDTQKVPYTVMALDTTGSPAVLATIVPDTTPVAGSVGNGFVVAGKKLQAGVVITALVTHKDGTTLPPVSAAVDVVSGVAASVTLILGTPVPQ